MSLYSTWKTHLPSSCPVARLPGYRGGPGPSLQGHTGRGGGSQCLGQGTFEASQMVPMAKVKKPLAKPKPPGAGSVPSQGLKKLWVSVRGEFCRLGRCFLVSVPRAEPVDAPMQSERKGGGWRAPRDAM